MAIAATFRGPIQTVAATVHSRYLPAKQQRRRLIEELIELEAHGGRCRRCRDRGSNNLSPSAQTKHFGLLKDRLEVERSGSIRIVHQQLPD